MKKKFFNWSSSSGKNIIKNWTRIISILVQLIIKQNFLNRIKQYKIDLNN